MNNQLVKYFYIILLLSTHSLFSQNRQETINNLMSLVNDFGVIFNTDNQSASLNASSNGILYSYKSISDLTESSSFFEGVVSWNDICSASKTWISRKGSTYFLKIKLNEGIRIKRSYNYDKQDDFYYMDYLILEVYDSDNAVKEDYYEVLKNYFNELGSINNCP
ncbi:hypothetical protein ACX0HA_03990 [Flavobacterium hauense]